MTTTEQIHSMPACDPLAFSVRTRSAKYGDNQTFHEFQILMRLNSRVVGSEAGPRRAHATASDARVAGAERVKVLRGHRLFAIDVTREDIENGEAHSCESCAIAQALFRNQKRMGFPKWSHTFRVAPYAGMFATAYGIALGTRMRDSDLETGAEGMPDLVSASAGVSCMMEWAMIFDEWADLQTMDISEWREAYGYSGDETPCKPWPVSFVLNLSEMRSDP